jgi:hypothetical protein
LFNIKEVAMNETATKKTTAKPVKTLRHGAVAASIWRRQSPTGFEYFEFSLSRSWKTKTTGKEGYSSNFFPTNEKELSAVVLEASAWIANQQTGTERDETTN